MMSQSKDEYSYPLFIKSLKKCGYYQVPDILRVYIPLS